MSTNHGGTVTQKPISEMAKYIKNLIPANIPETYTLKPMFKSVASEENIRNGVIAFRGFLLLFCDRLISDGHLYAKPQKNPKSMTDYPFLRNVTNLLIDIGYHGKLAENGDSLLISEMPSFAAPKPKTPVSKQIECMRFLASCGFVFSGIDLQAKTLDVSEIQLLEVSYPNDPILSTGLKAMSIADTELREERSRNDDIFLRCDYRVIKAEDTDGTDVLKDILCPLPEKVQKFALALHQRYIDMGMTCVTIISSFDVHFAYSYTKNSRRALSSRDVYYLRVWEFALTMRYGYCLVVRAKNTDKYADIIRNFPLSLQEKIAKGYGCDRKLRNERCQGGCQGFRIPLDDSILTISGGVETWLDNEVSFSIKK